MATQNPTDAEVFQRFLAEQVATTGQTMSPEELVRLWRERQKVPADAIEAIEQGLADVEANCVQPFDDVNNEIRRKHGWRSNG
jgi:hypothetical protein